MWITNVVLAKLLAMKICDFESLKHKLKVSNSFILRWVLGWWTWIIVKLTEALTEPRAHWVFIRSSGGSTGTHGPAPSQWSSASRSWPWRGYHPREWHAIGSKASRTYRYWGDWQSHSEPFSATEKPHAFGPPTEGIGVVTADQPGPWQGGGLMIPDMPVVSERAYVR